MPADTAFRDIGGVKTFSTNSDAYSLQTIRNLARTCYLFQSSRTTRQVPGKMNSEIQ